MVDPPEIPGVEYRKNEGDWKMKYKENPKTKGSGIVCCIPQTGTCPNNCEDCFFQSGRSYLEPLEENLPNMPQTIRQFQVVRVNDGNDSNIKRAEVIYGVAGYPMKFYNTSIPRDLEEFNDPVVLTINPGEMTDKDFHRVWTKNLMFVRFRANSWNLLLAQAAAQYYGDREVPIIMTFMAYFDSAEQTIPSDHTQFYTFRKRTLNAYWAITRLAWRQFMARWQGSPHEKWVYSCGKIEGEGGTTACRHCGNCLREYFATMERLIS